MAHKTLPSKYDLWKKHEAVYVEVFSAALGKLANLTRDISHEDNISEFLCPILHSVCCEKSKKSGREIRTPDWEKPIRPETEDELKGGKKRKRPDFTCTITNPFALNPSALNINNSKSLYI